MDSTIYEDPITATLELGSILIFSVDSIRFCSDMQQIESVVDYQPLSKLPNMPSWIAGGFWYQGDFAHVISVRKKFALPDPDNPKSGSFITTHIDNELFAFWVDRIEDATDAAKFNWQKLPTLNTGVFSRAILQDQHIILEVNLEKLKNTDSLNITNFVSTLSFTKAATKQPNDTETLSGTKRPNSITKPNSSAVNPIDNNVIDINKNKTSIELNHQPLTKSDPEKKPREGKNITKIPPIARSIRRSITRSTTTPEAIIATQAKEQPIANVKKLKETTIEYTQKNITLEKEIITRTTKTITKSNYTVSAQEPKQNITPDKQHYKQCDENNNQIANIASMLLLSTMISGLIYFTFGTSPDLKNTHSKAIQTHVGAEKHHATSVTEMNTQKIKRNTIQHTINESSQALVTETVIEKSQKIITIDTQNHQIIIHQRAEDQAPATTTVANNTLPEDILFIHAIVKGDTLWRIARQYLNDPYLYPELAKLSNINNPNLIYPGDVVKMKNKYIQQ